MNKIIALQDYNDRFGSKHFDVPYRSGMVKEKLQKYFAEANYDLEFMPLTTVINEKLTFKNIPIIYTSSEDINYLYKSFIEDVVLGQQETGAIMLPEYKFLRANNNKVFMEILRSIYLPDFEPQALGFGSLREIQQQNELKYPLVLKAAEGASGKSVYLVKNHSQLLNVLKQINPKDPFRVRVKEWLRPYRHKGYIREDRYRKKFIVQPFIENLKNDWKVYIFGNRLFIFKRPILKGRGIKASGGGYNNYFYGLDADAPEGLFDYASKIFNRLNIPHISLDIAFDGKAFYLIEFQALYFGTAGIPYSKGYFNQVDGEWNYIEEKLEIEQVYVDSIVDYLKKK